MQAYLVVLEVTPMKPGDVYAGLPLHSTLVHWFWLDTEPQEVAKHLKQAFRGVRPLELKAGIEQLFVAPSKQGPVKVKVNEIERTAKLADTHEKACAALEQWGVTYSMPQYVHDGFRPHVTHQHDGALKPGQAIISHAIYLVQADAPEYGNDRTVRAKLVLE